MDKPIILSGLSAAVFNARDSFHNVTKLKFPQRTGIKVIDKEESCRYDHVLHIVEKRAFGDRYYVGYANYNTEEEWLQDMLPYQLALAQYIYQYLKNNYSDTSYAEDFARSKAWGCESYWALKLHITYDDIIRKEDSNE